jgi:hypothetical protein
LDSRHVCKTCAFHDALQAGKQKEVHPPYSPDLTPAGARSGEYGGPFTEPFRHTTYFHNRNTALPVAVFTKLANSQRRCVHISSSKMHCGRTRRKFIDSETVSVPSASHVRYTR